MRWLQAFVESISYDRRLYKHDIAGSIAHATMLAKVGLIAEAERDKIIDGLKSIERDIEAGKFKFDESLEDIHMVIEAALIERIGEPGKKLHTGRSRNDQVAMDMAMWLYDTFGDLEIQCRDLCVAFVSTRRTRKRDCHAQLHPPPAGAANLCRGGSLGLGSDV